MVHEKKQINTTMLLLGLVVLNILLTLYVGFFKKDAYWLETLKVWWSENMQLATQLYNADSYKQQQKATLEQILWSMGTATPEAQTPPTDATQPEDTTTANTPADTQKFATIQKDGYIKGNKNAKITIIEYSDLLCPFCKKHYNAQTIENLIAKYPNDINMIFRQMPLPQLHPTAPLWAQWVVCAGKLAWNASYYDYLAKAFQLNEFTEANLTDIAVSLGISKTKFASCLVSPETIATVNAEVQEWQSFGINGTPGNIVVDNQKGTFTLIAGAYPTETFEAEIKKILGK